MVLHELVRRKALALERIETAMGALYGERGETPKEPNFYGTRDGATREVFLLEAIAENLEGLGAVEPVENTETEEKETPKRGRKKTEDKPDETEKVE